MPARTNNAHVAVRLAKVWSTIAPTVMTAIPAAGAKAPSPQTPRARRTKAVVRKTANATNSAAPSTPVSTPSCR